MVSSIGSGTEYIQQLFAQIMKGAGARATGSSAGASQDEISSAGSVGKNEQPDFLKMISEKFESIDSDKNGEVSKEELKSLVSPNLLGCGRHLGPPPGMSIENLFSSDTDGTAGLSKDELASVDTGDDNAAASFVKNLAKGFDKLDTNKDGQLSQEEIEAGRPQGPPPGNRSAEWEGPAKLASEAMSELGSKIGNLSEIFGKKIAGAYKDNASTFTSGLASALDLAV